MKAVERFRLEPVDDANQRSRLVEDTAVGPVIDGRVLEAQFAVTGGHLVVTADEDPFEGCLHFSLVSTDHRLVDAIDLGLPYSSGTFRQHTARPGDVLEFSFFEQELWRLVVATKPRLAFLRPLGAARYPTGRWRPHRLLLSRLGPNAARGAVG